MSNTACIFIDFINDIVSTDYTWASCAAVFKERNVAFCANKLIEFLRVRSCPVIHVKLGFKEDYSDLPKNSLMFSKALDKGIFKLNTPGTEFHKDLQINQDHLIITKKRVSAFYQTELDIFLTQRNITNLIICGASTNNAVQACARDAHDRDYLPIIIENVCAARNIEDHEWAIKFMNHFSKITTLENFAEQYEVS